MWTDRFTGLIVQPGREDKTERMRLESDFQTYSTLCFKTFALTGILTYFFFGVFFFIVVWCHQSVTVWMIFFYWLYFCYACWGITVLSLHLSSFQSSVLGQQGAFPDTGGTVMVSAKQSSRRRCSRATRPASVATFRQRLSCTQKPCRQIHRAASCTATVQQRSLNWDGTNRHWTMLGKLVS